MNIVHYTTENNLKIVYIIIDRTYLFQNSWTKEIIKNISDFTVSNIWSKNYDVMVGVDEDQMLSRAIDLGYACAVVLSTGTEFINGDDFFDLVKNLSDTDFFLIGHILDRGDAYYELHHQCYVINLKIYKDLDKPIIGKPQLGEKHQQIKPIRSEENIHDDYTPIWIKSGTSSKEYSHKLHGWNIISAALKSNFDIEPFDNEFRNSKKYYYPENQEEFLKQLSWAHARERFCSSGFVHKQNTEIVEILDRDFECIITPASGTWFLPYIATDRPVEVIYYDYNDSALEYWKNNCLPIKNVTYKFIKIDLLSICDYESLLSNRTEKTLLNLSNIFCYEGTCVFSDLTYRLYKENELLSKIPKNYFVLFNSRSCLGYTDAKLYGKNLKTICLSKLKKPTWRIYDWS